jgi:hypothetical protein
MVQERVDAALARYEAVNETRSQLMAEVKSLGYEPNLDDPRTYALLSLAAKNDGDLSAAHELLTGITGAADAASKPDAESSTTPADSDELVPAPDGVPASGTPTQPTTFDEASERALLRFDTEPVA